jgi:glycosyltransferase involved in cell wall biosynthesis
MISDTAPMALLPELISCSVVVPVYNGAESLDELVSLIHQELQPLCTAYEVILVNDGSHDNSWELIEKLTQTYSWIRGINLMRNYGQHNTLLCGIRHAQYAIIVTMDDDMQHPPNQIHFLLEKLDQGYDVVYGIPRKLPHSLFRNLMSRLIKYSLSRAMGIKSIRDISAFRAFHTHLRQAFANYQSPSLLLDVLLSWGTSKFATVEVNHEPRRKGQSGYNFIKLFNQTMLIFTGFSTDPLRLASLLGFIFSFFGFIVLVYVVGRYAIERSVPGFPFLASIIAIFSGTQLFTLGIIGEYLARIFHRTMERPTYVIDSITGRSKQP